MDASNWSAYQKAIFDDVARGEGHTVVVARAGSGKTSTIVEALKHVPAGKGVLLCAFNKRIEEELSRRAPAGVTVRTLHSLGFAAVRAAWGRVRVNKDRIYRRLDAVLPRLRGLTRQGVVRLIGMAKNTLADTPDQIADLAYEVGVAHHVNGELEKIVGAVAGFLAETERRDEIDFDDMVYLPVKNGLSVGKFDFVFVDETQDLSRAQIEMALSACAPGGRIVAVGDDRQACYAFRGADSRAIPGLIDRLDAKVLPLSVTYRCPRAVVRLAQEVVPDLEVYEGAEEGEVVTERAAALDGASAGDFVLSRTNAPLVGLCLSYLRRGMPAKIAGRDVGTRIKGLIERAVKKCGSRAITDVLVWAREWAEREAEKLVKIGRERKADEVYDILETVVAITDGCSTLDEVEARCETLFTDGNGAAGRITLSTVHKAKGLEAERVFALTDTFKRDRGEEEDNIWYIAITRAQRTLVLVEGYPRKNGEG